MNRALGRVRLWMPLVLPLMVLAAVAALFLIARAAGGDVIADIVLGQANFTASGAAAGQAGMNGPVAVAVDLSGTTHPVYVADTANNRVMGWLSVASLANGASAVMEIGQLDFTGTAANRSLAAPTSATLSSPRGVAVDSNGNLYVADFGNNRVLEYTTPITGVCTVALPCENQAAATVFGQTLFTTATPATTQTGMSGPSGVAIGGSNTVFVADTTNNRVLVFTETLNPPANFTANVEFGQVNPLPGTDFTHGVAGSGTQGLTGPTGVALDQNNVYIADNGNNRVLVFNELAALPANFTANEVFGQADFASVLANRGGAAGANTLASPKGVGLDAAHTLYIADFTNNRVLEFLESANPPANFTANFVVGQGSSGTNFTSTAAGTTDIAMSGPSGVALDSGNSLYVADTTNNRALQFLAPVVTPTPTPTPTATPTPTPTPTPATPTPTPATPTPTTATPTPTPTPATPTPTPATPTPTPTPATPTPTPATPTPTPTPATPTPTPATPTPTPATPTPTLSPIPTQSPTPSQTPTVSPSPANTPTVLNCSQNISVGKGQSFLAFATLGPVACGANQKLTFNFPQDSNIPPNPVQTPTTNAQGQAAVQFVAPVVCGNYSYTVSFAGSTIPNCGPSTCTGKVNDICPTATPVPTPTPPVSTTMTCNSISADTNQPWLAGATLGPAQCAFGKQVTCTFQGQRQTVTSSTGGAVSAHFVGPATTGACFPFTCSFGGTAATAFSPVCLPSSATCCLVVRDAPPPPISTPIPTTLKVSSVTVHTGKSFSASATLGPSSCSLSKTIRFSFHGSTKTVAVGYGGLAKAQFSAPNTGGVFPIEASFAGTAHCGANSAIGAVTVIGPSPTPIRAAATPKRTPGPLGR